MMINTQGGPLGPPFYIKGLQISADIATMDIWKQNKPSDKEIEDLVENGFVERNVCRFCKTLLQGRDFCGIRCETAAVLSVLSNNRFWPMIQAFRSKDNKDFIVIIDEEIWEMNAEGYQRYLGMLEDRKPTILAWQVVPRLDNLPVVIQSMVAERAEINLPTVQSNDN